jgi:hypothetical protein
VANYNRPSSHFKFSKLCLIVEAKL